MITQLTGALVRALLTVIVVVAPSLVLPGRPGGAEIVMLLALVAGLLVFVEYISVYPGLMEFSSAPPFNRIRYLMLLAMVLCLAAICRGAESTSSVAGMVSAVGVLIGHVIDIPLGPVGLLVGMADDPQSAAALRAMGGIAYLVVLVSLAAFVAIARFAGWPGEQGFNFWTNLPTFEPTASPDVVLRLKRDARFNVALGLGLPFLIPPVVTACAPVLPPIGLEAPQTLIWVVAAWAFLPASMVMRGLAMGLVAEMIVAQRRPGVALQPA